MCDIVVVAVEGREGTEERGFVDNDYLEQSRTHKALLFSLSELDHLFVRSLQSGLQISKFDVDRIPFLHSVRAQKIYSVIGHNLEFSQTRAYRRCC